MKKNAVGKNRKRENRAINRKKINGQERDKNAEGEKSLWAKRKTKKNEKNSMKSHFVYDKVRQASG